MEDKYSEAKRTIKMIILILSLFILIILSLLIIMKLDIISYLAGSGKQVDLNATIQGIPQLKNSSFGDVYQFYPNMKFNHNNISYNINSDCAEESHDKMLEAFDIFSKEIGFIIFYPVMENEDIGIVCSPEEKTIPEESDFFIAGEGGAKEIIQTGRFNVITRGVILLYGNKEGIKCIAPETELHELIHVFGFGHSLDKESLMYPYLTDCSQKLDESIINEVIRLYSKENLPDIYFENISAVKKGRYLDFNITIQNSGDVPAKNVSYSILDDGKLAGTKIIGDIKYGSGVVLEVKNFKLTKRDSKEIKIIIDYYNETNEIDKNNNVAILNFNT